MNLMNWIISFLEWNNIEDVVKKFLSASCAHCKSLQILFIIYCRLYTRYRLNQAFHESYELDHFPVDLHHLATNNEAPMMSYIASVLLVLTADSMRVERLVSLYNDVKTIRRSGLSEETVNDRLAIAFKSTGVANWDTQPAVAKFLTEKKHRGRQPLIKTDIKTRM